MDIAQVIRQYAEDGNAVRTAFFASSCELVEQAAHLIANAIRNDGKILIIGNGGSAADAQHWAAEYVNRFLIDRRPLPALALTTDSSVLTAISNDFGYDAVFSKQIEALGKKGDVLLAISTSGNSSSVLKAAETARLKGISVIGLTGKTGGKLVCLCDVLLNVPSDRTPIIQEVHETIGHLLCDLTDRLLFSEKY
ncbi:MAG: D-sedoheptulose 7-phosphate isomerase [Desulfovibrionaceae bacterium]|nr:D-sedoheptulose 7-phosphate isomerase [Desulfovibrionaceae bacterium]